MRLVDSNIESDFTLLARNTIILYNQEERRPVQRDAMEYTSGSACQARERKYMKHGPKATLQLKEFREYPVEYPLSFPLFRIP